RRIDGIGRVNDSLCHGRSVGAKVVRRRSPIENNLDAIDDRSQRFAGNGEIKARFVGDVKYDVVTGGIRIGGVGAAPFNKGSIEQSACVFAENICINRPTMATNIEVVTAYRGTTPRVTVEVNINVKSVVG